MREEYVLIVDDQEINREVLRLMFEKDYQILEAESGAECLRIAREYGSRIVLVLLDLLMPVMDGYEVLRLRQKNEVLRSTPVIVITASENSESQVEALRLGASDYIVKPFVKEVAQYRAHNAIQISAMMRHIEQERIDFQRKSERDLLTGLYNKSASEARIVEQLRTRGQSQGVLFMFDVDDFKQVNDTMGHVAGDESLRHYASFISSFFRSSDVVGRFGGDEFVAYMNFSGDRSIPQGKIRRMYESLANQAKAYLPGGSLSAGIAYTGPGPVDYKTLLTQADTALYQAKKQGKNCFVEYESL